MLSSSTDPLEILTDALREKRPLVLFAGQSLDSSHDAILGALLDRFGCTNRNPGWRAALDQGISASDMAWLSERFDRSVLSDAAAPIFDVAWSAVFTSSIDPRFARRFETRGRQPEPVLSRDAYARVPRSRSRPPIHYLLGKSDETVEDVRAPGKQSDLMRRISLHAMELLNRIAETATARGLVVIAGYDPSKDWMPLDSLLVALSDQAGPKVLWFDHQSKPDSIFADEMIQRGSLVLTTTTLASAISQLELCGVLDVVGSAAPDEPGIVSIAGGAALDITPALRLRVEASAAIVDDGWTEDPEPLGESEQDDAFRRFHSTPGNFRLLVEGVAHGFAVEREFEQTLWKVVNNKLKRLGQPDSDDVVVLHGQSGTGKSIALARLTRKIRRELRLPVVVATNRIPNHADIEAFCIESERLETVTVLICDSSQAPQRYDDLASALRSRGRRLLIVGTCYRMETHAGHKLDQFVEASDSVSQGELSAFKALQNEFRLPPHYDRATADSIFAMLYRRLPAAREHLAAGVSSEARATESMVRERARHVPQPSTRLSPLAQQLIDSGIASPTSQVFEEEEKLATVGLDAAGRLIDYVMVAGRLNCAVPVNLIFRVLGQTDGLHQDQILYLLADLDLFRWREDEEGSDFLIAPRIQLEAELICRRRLSPDQEIERLIDLISSIRSGVDKHAERSFLLDLLFKIDRNGPRKEAYSPGYLRFADALKELREHNRISDPDLVLRECVFRRRAVRQLQNDCGANKTDDERLAILDEARDTIEKTLRQIDDEKTPLSRISRKTKQSLVAERSAIYGYLAVEHAQPGSGEDFWSDYLAARAASEKAIGLDRSTHPIDIALWTASDVLKIKKGELSDEQRAEVLADLYATIDVADDVFRVKEQTTGKPSDLHEDSDPDEGLVVLDQKARYLERRSRVASVMGDAKLSDETLAELESVAPAAATFLIAKHQAEHVYMSEPPFDDKIRGIAAKAADYIYSKVNAGTELDDRCQRLLLRLRWAQATGERLMFNERSRTPWDRDQISDMREIVSALNEQAGADARNRERFLEAVLCWLLKDTNRAIEIWQSLSNDTEYEDRSRLVRWLVVTGESGSPRQFRGRVEERGENDWWIRVEGVDRPIKMSGRDFPNDNLSHGRELRGFGIAFNYIGPIADPLSRPVRR